MIDLTHIATVMQWQTPNERTLWCARAVGGNVFHKGETAEEAIKLALRDVAPTEVCSVCGSPQFETPSGVTCKNGHGGAPATAQPDDVSDLF